MKEPVNDAERLSALLDGQLSDRERNELLARLAVPGDEYHVFAETAAMLLEMEEEDARARQAGTLKAPHATSLEESAPREPNAPVVATPLRAYVLPPLTATRGDPDDLDEPDVSEARPPEVRPDRTYPPPPRKGGWRRRSVAAAAVLMLALASGLLVRGRAPAAASPLDLAAGLGQQGTGYPDQWLSKRVWDVNRGGQDPAEGSGAAVRAGAMLVDLSVAVGARNTEQIGLLASQINQRYLGLPEGTGPFGRIAARPADPPEALRPLVAEGTERLEELLVRGPLRAGAWVEAANLATNARNEDFFRARSTRTPPRALEQLVANDAEARAALGSVRQVLAAGGAPDWAALDRSLVTLMTRIAKAP